jgi:hypothetical protein
MCISETEKNFPYRFLLRWSWPEHIDRVMRRVLWAWLSERASECTDDVRGSDYAAAQLVWLIVVSPETPAAVLDILSKSASEAVLVRIAENQNTWASTLMRMVENPSHLVRTAVADNPNTPECVMLSLAMDAHDDVRHAVAENANLTQTLLECLAADQNCHVAARAKKTITRLRPAGEAVQLPSSYQQAKRTSA